MDSSFVKYAKSRHIDAYSLKPAFSGRKQITPRIHTALKKKQCSFYFHKKSSQLKCTFKNHFNLFKNISNRRLFFYCLMKNITSGEIPRSVIVLFLSIVAPAASSKRIPFSSILYRKLTPLFIPSNLNVRTPSYS